MPELIEIKGEQVLKDLVGTIDIQVMDSLVITRSIQDQDILQIHFMAEAPFAAFGDRGRGPNEVLSARVIPGAEHQEYETFFWINDVSKREIMKIDLNKSLAENELRIKKRHQIPSASGLQQDIHWLSEKVIVGNMGIEAQNPFRYRLYDVSLDSVIYTNHNMPSVMNNQSGRTPDYYTALFTILEKRPGKAQIVSAFNYLDRLDIYDLDLKDSISIKGTGPTDQMDYELYLDKDRLTYYYFDLAVSEDYIFALYYNQVDADYGDVVQPTEIRVFDWDGNILHRFKTPEYLMSISFSQDHQLLYGVAFIEEKILKYNLSRFLQ